MILKDRAPLDIIAARMPGARIEEWEVEDERPATLTTKTRKAIIAYLAALPPEATKVSLKKLKADLGLVDLHNKTFQTARDAALKATGWRLAGLSVVLLRATAIPGCAGLALVITDYAKENAHSRCRTQRPLKPLLTREKEPVKMRRKTYNCNSTPYRRRSNAESTETLVYLKWKCPRLPINDLVLFGLKTHAVT